jgi:hypothetical protein
MTFLKNKRIVGVARNIVISFFALISTDGFHVQSTRSPDKTRNLNSLHLSPIRTLLKRAMTSNLNEPLKLSGGTQEVS